MVIFMQNDTGTYTIKCYGVGFKVFIFKYKWILLARRIAFPQRRCEAQSTS